jgi:hypothetical protein
MKRATLIPMPIIQPAQEQKHDRSARLSRDRPRPNSIAVDTRRLQHFLGHASITNTVRYTAMSPEPFKDIWR